MWCINLYAILNWSVSRIPAYKNQCMQKKKNKQTKKKSTYISTQGQEVSMETKKPFCACSFSISPLEKSNFRQFQ